MNRAFWFFCGLAKTAVVICVITGSLVCAQTSDADRIKSLERQLAQQKHTLADWGGLNRYGSDNTELPPLPKGEERIIFFGDQITEFWGRDNPTFFPGKPFPGQSWLNRGVAGQTTGQMLVRFRQDVLSLHPKAVVILGGLNDVAGLRGLVSEELILDNITSMMELAKANGIQVVLASLTPVCDCFTKGVSRQRWQERISEVNELIKKYCEQSGAIYLDYFSALAGTGDAKDQSKDMKMELTRDGVVPNEAGYALLVPLARRAIAEALKK